MLTPWLSFVAGFGAIVIGVLLIVSIILAVRSVNLPAPQMPWFSIGCAGAVVAFLALLQVLTQNMK